MNTQTLKIKRLHPDAVIPEYQTPGAACFDLHAVIDDYSKSTTIKPGQSATFRTGLSVEIPEGWRMDVFSRSGHGFKCGVRLANGTGKIDSDYRGEIMVCLHNDGPLPLLVIDGRRIAQAEINPVYRAVFEVVDELTETERGTGGFGSTGV